MERRTSSLSSLPLELSLQILSKLNPLSIKKLRAASPSCSSAASRCVGSLEWDDDDAAPPRAVDLATAFPHAEELVVKRTWPSARGLLQFLAEQHALASRLKVLHLDLRASTEDVHDAAAVYAALCTALCSLRLEAPLSPLCKQLSCLTHLTRLHLELDTPYSDLVQVLAKLPNLQQLVCQVPDGKLRSAGLAMTSQLARLSSLDVWTEGPSSVSFKGLAAATQLVELQVDLVAEHTSRLQSLACLTQLSRLDVRLDCNSSAPLPAGFTRLTRLTFLSVCEMRLDAGDLARLASLLGNLPALQCWQIGCSRTQAALLHRVGCTSLKVDEVVTAPGSELPAGRQLFPRLQTLRLHRPPLHPLLLRQTSLTSLSLRSMSHAASDEDCRCIADGLPQLCTLQLQCSGSSAAEVAALGAGGLQQLARLEKLQQLCLMGLLPPHSALLWLAARCKALRRLVLGCGWGSAWEVGGLEVLLSGLAAASRLEHLVLLAQEGRSAQEALQQVCDRVVSMWARHELGMEVRGWYLDEAWRFMTAGQA
jgi:hypothetical protein